MMDLEETQNEKEADFEKIEQMYSRAPLESPSPSVLERIRNLARKEKKSWWAVLWHQPRAVGAFAILLIMVSVGLIYKNELANKQGEFIPEPSGAPLTRLPETPPPPRDVTFTLPDRPIGVEIRKAEFVVDRQPAPAENIGVPALPDLTLTAPKRDRLFFRELEEETASNVFGDHSLKIARSLESRGKWSEAEKIYSELWGKNPSQKKRATILFHWAYVLEMSGRKAQSLEKLLDLEKTNPSYPGLREAISRLRR